MRREGRRSRAIGTCTGRGAPYDRRIAGPPGFGEPLRSACLRVVRAQRAALGDEDDLAQEVLLAIGGSRSRWIGRSSFRTWLWAVVRRRLRDRRRQAATERRALHELAIAASLADEGEPSPEQVTIRREEHARALAALASLPRASALGFVLLRVADWTAEEVARRLGTTPGAVRVRAYRVARRLREVLADSIPPPAYIDPHLDAGQDNVTGRSGGGRPKRRGHDA